LSIINFQLKQVTESYINIGKIVAPFGLTGEIILQHGLGVKTDLKDVTVIFIEQVKGSYLPYFVQRSKAKEETEMYIKVEGIDSKEAARVILHKQVWLTEPDFRKLAGTSSPIALIGYTLINEGDPIGIIEEVIEQPHQVLLRIDYKSKEALIPLHEETLDKIDKKKKEVHVTLPDGLLEIYE
jgi:16S rRNA processing protein RimM